jgi:hypothetical protein
MAKGRLQIPCRNLEVLAMVDLYIAWFFRCAYCFLEGRRDSGVAIGHHFTCWPRHRNV